jgi:moderate conductance mechanosensitive channel
LEETAQSIYNDPQWQSSLLEPPQTIGIENLSSEGISLRIWMKTKPGLQWTVARELRLRVIDSFNRSQVDIASPHQTISLQNIPTNKNDNSP